MADGKKNNDGFRTGFLGDMLKDLQEQLEHENKAKGKGRRSGSSKKPLRSLLNRREPPTGSTGLPHCRPGMRRTRAEPAPSKDLRISLSGRNPEPDS